MTVSRVVNNDPRVKKETRERVLRVIQEIDYYPNAAARALNSQKAMTIGLVLPRDEYVLSEPYFAQLIYHLEKFLAPRAYDLLLVACESKVERDLAVLFRQKKIDGIIVLGSQIGDGRLEAISRNNIPTVLMHASSDLPSISWVDVDNLAMIDYFVDYLTGLAHKSIGFITGDLTVLDARQRLSGFEASLEKHDIRFDESLVFKGDWSSTAGYEAFLYFNSLHPGPTAIISSNDHMAIGFIKAAHEYGASIPGDFSIVGVDDIEMSSFTTPALTTMRQPIGRIAEIAVENLMKSIKLEGKWQSHALLEAEPIIRDPASPAGNAKRIEAFPKVG